MVDVLVILGILCCIAFLLFTEPGQAMLGTLLGLIVGAVVIAIVLALVAIAALLLWWFFQWRHQAGLPEVVAGEPSAVITPAEALRPSIGGLVALSVVTITSLVGLGYTVRQVLQSKAGRQDVAWMFAITALFGFALAINLSNFFG